jgi:predicted phage terminase large subunit-like protein
MQVQEVLKEVDARLLTFSEGRRELCRLNPLLFAIVYMPHHLMDATGRITLSEFHVDLADYYGRTLPFKSPTARGPRDAWIAPRGCGKSTWLFTIIPIWAAAYGHIKFAAAFSDAASQAETHLMTFKTELLSNEYLNTDFPELCALKKGKDSRPVADSAWRTMRANGFIFDANGIDTNSLGKKVGAQRPDFIILDDIEKGEKNYSEYQAGQQKNTVLDDIAPMGAPGYQMVFVGTTTMPNSVMDQFRKYVDGYHEDRELMWIKDHNINVHYYPAILTADDATERSVWPEKWPLPELQSQRHRRDFAKNFMNKPMAIEGALWEDGDIQYHEAASYGNTLISIDPAVTKNKFSDYTGIAVLSRGEDEEGHERLYVREAMQVKLGPEELAEKVKMLAELYESGVTFVETNQGGDLWRNVFKDVPGRYRSNHNTDSKSIRAQKALNYYQRDMVRHTRTFPTLEEQMWAFPKVSHDDVIDAVVNGILYFLDRKAVKIGATQYTYI